MEYQITLISGRYVEFEANSHEYEEGIYRFFLDGELVGEFIANNIAGFTISEEQDD